MKLYHSHTVVCGRESRVGFAFVELGLLSRYPNGDAKEAAGCRMLDLNRMAKL